MSDFDYFALDPADIETSDMSYGRFRFLYVDGVAKIIGKTVVAEAPGTIARTGAREWTVTLTDGSTWRIVDGGGCNCKGGIVTRR